MKILRLVLVFIALVINHANSFGKHEKKPPNIVLIMGDDIGWNDFGFHGQNQIPTPNIDALAYNGIVLKKFYTLPTGSASMAALLTGRYPMRFGMQGPSIEPGEDRSLPSSIRILPQWLKQLGYKTHLIGKWNLGYARKTDTPLSKGFDSFFGVWNKFVGHFDYETSVEAEGCHGATLKTSLNDEEEEQGYETQEVIDGEHGIQDEPFFKPTKHTVAPWFTKPSTTEEPVYTKPSKRPTHHHTTEEPEYTRPSKRPTHHHTTEEPEYTRPSKRPTHHYTTEEPEYTRPTHYTTEEPEYTRPSKRPTHHHTTEEPEYTKPSKRPTHHHTTEEPEYTKPSKWPTHHTTEYTRPSKRPTHHHTTEEPEYTRPSKKPSQPWYTKPEHTKPTGRPTHKPEKPDRCIMHGFDLHDGLKPAWKYRGEYATHLFSKKAINVIEKHNKKEPLFLFVSHLAGHCGKNNTEIEVPNVHQNDKDFGYISDIGRRRYAGAVSEFDKSVGKIVKTLEAKGLLHNSIIMILSDNGAKPEGRYANKGSNWPFKGMKGTPHEGGVRGTAVIFSPLLKFKDSIFNHLFHITDVLPTFVAAAGGEATKSSFMDGVSHWNCLKDGGKTQRHELLVNIDEEAEYSAIISNDGKYKYIEGTYDHGSCDGYHGDSGRGIENPSYDWNKVFNSDVNYAIKKTQLISNLLTKEKSHKIRNELDFFTKCDELKRTGKPKICKPYCLFDLDEDPCETNDLSEKFLNVKYALKDKLAYMSKGLVQQKKHIINAHANPNICFSNWFPWKDWALFCNERPKTLF